MTEWLSWGVALHVLIGAGLAVSLAFCLIGFASAWQFFRNPQPADEPRILPGVSVLKPLKGLEASLYENLATFCDQDYPTFQIVFGVADADDPAVGIVRRLQGAYPGVRIDLVVDARAYGTNYKVSNLHNMYQTAAHEVIVLADSDMRVPRDYLRRVTAALADPTVGMVTCLYRALPTRGSANLTEALFINTTFAFLIMVARVVEKPTYAFGATMAMRRARLDEIGGFLPLVDYLADDFKKSNGIDLRDDSQALQRLFEAGAAGREELAGIPAADDLPGDKKHHLIEQALANKGIDDLPAPFHQQRGNTQLEQLA